MRGIIIGSSMSLPTEELKYEDTYVHLLRERYPDIEWIHRFLRSSSIERLNKEGFKANGYDNLEFYTPDFVIVHIGVTDASPRYLPRRKIMVKILNMSPFAKYIYKFLRKHSYRKIKYCDVSLEDFRKNLEKYAQRCLKSGTKLILVEISMAHETLIKTKSPEMNHSYEIYNKIFHEIAEKYPNATLINGLRGENDLYQSDYIHANKKGQKIFFDRLSGVLNKFILEKDK